ncbi:tyrosine-type recombinase/integrase [Butyrivibrio sp. AE2015]|uniref:tyrosine-type recombinase/integrase n=1 Tax=Butyrivibrio sp. AE2015 TaxID=1280663 RepID=UPI0003B78497|nr:tyrosine-type recombinase/integrase [Butyrivibrio sp. AE2015]
MNQQINEFVEHLHNVKKTSENTCLSYKRDLERMAAFMHERGIDEVSGVTEDKITDYANSLRNENFAPASITRHYTSMKAFFRYMVENGNITDSPAEILKSPHVKKNPPRVLSAVEIEGLLSQKFPSDAKGKRDKAILELLYATGLKASELVNLKLSNVDLGLGCIRLPRSSGDTRERLIPYGKKAKTAMHDYLLNARREMIGSCDDEEFVFVNCNGTSLSRQGLWKLIKTYVRKAGVDSDITIFTLRHSFAAHLVENGADISSVQELMGYADSNTISQYISKDEQVSDPYGWARIRN